MVIILINCEIRLHKYQAWLLLYIIIDLTLHTEHKIRII
jgi:hypothetical protein